jgi:hypothetical protein
MPISKITTNSLDQTDLDLGLTGNVGIGTTTPNAKLQVVSTTSSGQNITRSTAGQIALSISSTLDTAEFGKFANGNSYVSANGAYSLGMWTNGTERMQITSDGNVRIGATTGGGRLYVRSATNDYGLRVEPDNTGSNLAGIYYEGTNPYFYLFSGGTISHLHANGTSLRFYTLGSDGLVFLTSGFERVRIDSNGQLLTTIGGTSLVRADYGCRAWVNFNGTGTVAIRASGNVSSITDNGTGDYTVNFASAMPDANFVGNVSASGPVATQHNVTFLGSPGSNDTSSHPNSSSFRFSTYLVTNSATRADGAMYNVSIVR